MNRVYTTFRQQFTRLPQRLNQGIQHVRRASNQSLRALCCRSIDTINHSDHNNTPALPLPPLEPIQTQNDILRTTLDNWVNEVPEERDVRQRVIDKIQIINGQLVVEGNLDLRHTNISSLPEGLHVGGHLYLFDCTSLTTLPQGLRVGGHLCLEDCSSLTTLPQGLHVGGDLYLGFCTRLTSLPDWVFNVSNLKYVPAPLQQTDTYKTFQILKHFDSHNTIDDINNQELINLYNNDQDQIKTLIHNRHCFRIAHALCNNNQLTPQQLTFKNTANEQTKNQIRDHLVHMITSFKPDIFKKLPGINNTLGINIDSDNNSDIGILPFVANFGFLSASETQRVRMACKSFKEREILDQKIAHQNNQHLWPSLHTIEQALQA